jgi:peptidoglycan-associated lipoprotein
MRLTPVVLLIAALGTPLAIAQVGPNITPYVPRYTVALGYQYIRANAPPGSCNCFSTNGGFAEGAYAFRYWLRAAAEVTGSQASNIGPLGQNLTLMTYTAGPQVVLHVHRLEPYAQALFGAAHASNSYFPSSTSYSTSATSFAYQAGGGIDFTLSRHIGIKVIEAQYLHTGFPNGTNGAQSHLMLGAGIVFRLHGSSWTPDPGNERAKANAQMHREDKAADAAAVAAPVAPEPAAPRHPAITSSTADFSSSVKNAYFDYDSYQIRPDAKVALQQDAVYMVAHPDLRIVVGGYSDERGTAEYNIALGEKRASAARDALIANGVSPSQLEVVSYGKELQSCSTENEACFQLNRRAGFEPRQ